MSVIYFLIRSKEVLCLFAGNSKRKEFSLYFSTMAEGSAASNFDNYIAELHDNLDRLREIPDVDEQCATLVADLAQAYSEQPSPMQTGRENFFI